LTRFIGDVQGNWKQYQNICKSVTKTVQLGNFGVTSDRTPAEIEAMNEFMASTDNRFIRGNNDDPELLDKLSGYIPDMTVEGDTMFFGGAAKTEDHLDETLPQFPETSITYMKKAIREYAKAKPRVMITHDGPEDIVREMFLFYRRDYLSITRQGFAKMLSIHKPQFWIFSHWGIKAHYVKGPTEFIAFGPADYMDINL